MRDFSEFKTMLETRLGELDARIHKIEDRLDDPVSKDWEDQAVEREDFEVLEDLGKSGMKEMEMIRAALGRINDGSYGECARCGEDISDERLRAVPTAVFCINCAQEV